MRFPQFKITTRLAGGFAALILLGAGVAAYAVVQLNGVRSQVDTMQSLAANLQRVLESGQLLEVQRGAEFEYSVNGDDKTLQDGSDAQTKILALLDEAAKDAASPDQQRALNDVAASLRAHAQTVKRLVELSNQVKAERQKLNSKSDELAFSSTSVTERAQSTDDIALRNAAGEVDRSILLMRVAQWRGAETTERNAQNRFTQAAGAAKAAIDDLEKVASSDVKDLLPMLRDGIDACVAAFNVTFEDHAKLATMVTEELRPQITQSLAQLHEASVAMKANFAVAAKSGGATLATTALVQQILAFAVLLTGALLAVLIGQGIATPLARITAAMGTLAQGNLTVNVPGIDRKDEVGSMAEAVNVFKQNAVERARLERETAAARTAAEAERERTAAERARAAEEQAQVVHRLGEGLKNLAAGVLTSRLDAGFAASYAQIRNDFNEAIDKLKETMLAVVSSADTIQTGTREISCASDDLLRRSEQQAASLEETAAQLTEITQTVKKAAEGAQHARQVVVAADEDAKNSSVVVRETVDAMNAIVNSSQQIGQIIGVIDEIAFQTNLLALNAGVEAARAGDAGKGFAVVASEVRALAQRSAEAAKEIKALISSSTAQVDHGVKLVAETGKSLERIMTRVTDLNAVISDIASGAQEQATALEEVNTAISNMDKATQQNASMVQKSTAASHTLSLETEQLAGLIGQFQVGADRAATRPDRENPAPPALRRPSEAAVAHRRRADQQPQSAQKAAVNS